MMIINVIDTGIGISSSNIENLFQIFGKLKSSSSINQSGVGLGLTICKKICEFMGGSVTVSSE
jgi:signal transduction histidine kinase